MGTSIAFVETSGVSSDELKALCREIIPDVKVYQLIDDSLIQEEMCIRDRYYFARRFLPGETADKLIFLELFKLGRQQL